MEDKRIYYEDGKKNIYIYILNRSERIGWYRIDESTTFDDGTNRRIVILPNG